MRVSTPFFEINDNDADWEEPEEDCGRQPDGLCLYAGTEFCDWDCPMDGGGK